MKDRSEDVKTAAAKAYYESRRPRRAKIMQVPRHDAPVTGTGPMRPVVVPFTTRPITWGKARQIGKAYGRILEIRPPWPSAKDAADERALNEKRTEARKYLAAHPEHRQKRLKRESGMWWTSKFADVVDRRKDLATPTFRARKNRRATGRIGTRPAL